MSKGFITNLTNLGQPVFDEQLMLKESIHGTMCAVHNTANLSQHFPCSQHQMLQVCTTPNIIKEKPTSLKSKMRSKSPVKSPTKKTVTFPCQNWATMLATSSHHICKDNGNHTITLSRNAQYPSVVPNAFEANLEKVTSCPDRSCSCVSNPPSRGQKRCSIKSMSTVEVSNSSPAHSQAVQHDICQDSVVFGLKNEIEKVKSQLEQLTVSNSEKSKLGGRGEPEKQISQLKAENKHLKKELDQKKKLYMASVRDVERAKDILSDYEKKVILLHEQAVQSSKLMKQSKDKFCKCINQKESVIKELKKSNENLHRTVQEKEEKYVELSKTFENMQDLLHENNEQYSTVSENNRHFADAIKLLEKQLENSLKETEEYKNEVKKLEQQIVDFECKVCAELEARARKQKEKYVNRIKEHEGKEKILKEKISELSSQIEVANGQKATYEQLQNECNELQTKIREYEKFASKYSVLEEKYQKQCELAIENERKFDKDREELRNLVEELTNVIKQNKVTLLQLSEINKQQESLIASQSAILLEKDEMMKTAESEIEMLRKKSIELEDEIDNLRKVLEGPCSRDACLSLSKELQEMKIALNIEKDNELLKEKIIEDQSHTIASLHEQMKEKMSELSRAKEESSIAEEEIFKINEDLMRKHRELEKEMSEKEHLMLKLKNLEYQKSALTEEMSELEKVLDRYCEEKKCDEDQQEAIMHLQKKVAAQRREWEMHTAILAEEKGKAVKAAKFATQKLIDTVADFQKQVNAQKKVQFMLTKMLHDKEEELQAVNDRISSINSIATGLEGEIPLDEIYRRSRVLDLSNPTTTTSFYSSCSNCCPKYRRNCGKNCPKSDLHQLFEMISRSEEPIKDIRSS